MVATHFMLVGLSLFENIMVLETTKHGVLDLKKASQDILTCLKIWLGSRSKC